MAESQITVEVKGAFEDFKARIDRAGRSMRASPHRARGWNDLADVIENQDGKMAVRNGMRDVLDWLGE